jgi:hypothetical protein
MTYIPDVITESGADKTDPEISDDISEDQGESTI